MFGSGFKLFRLFGFTVKIDLSFIIIVFLIVFSLAKGVFPFNYKNLPQWQYWAMGAAGAIGLFASIVFHELCHSLVARRFNLPIRGITLFIFGGVAEMTEEPESAKAEFFMAVAGPGSSVVLGAAFYGAWVASGSYGAPTAVTGTLGWLALINALLAAFNLIPAFPLDGGRVLRSILWYYKDNLRWATRVASQIGSGFGIFLIGAGIVYIFAGYAIGGLWWILIGFFLRSAARQSYQQLIVRQILEGEHVRRFMNPNAVTVEPNTTVRQLVEDFVYRYHYKMFPVVEHGKLAGCVTTKDIKDVPREEWDKKTVADVVTQCSLDNTIGPDEDAVKALSKMSRAQESRLMVVDRGQLAGVISLKDLLDFLSLKIELEEEGTPPPQ